jgi:pantetheine-phosphate adenylyltransferase
MERVAVFPGSFDPFTIGHEHIVRRALTLFDKVIIAIGTNSEKSGRFPLDQRMNWISQVFDSNLQVSVQNYSGLTVDFCNQNNSKFIIRGLRTSADFEYERAIAQVNKVLMPEIETVFILTAPEHSAITSSLVREIIQHGGDASKFLPKAIRIH